MIGEYMELLDEEKTEQIREFITQFRAELILIMLSVLIIIASSTLFLITPTQAKTPPKSVNAYREVSSKPPTKHIYVDIAGAVLYPDVYKLPENIRLKALIEKAGGFSQNADIDQIEKTMNMSRILTDQEKIYIPKQGDGAAQVVTTIEEDPLIHINSASLESLKRLVGVGDTTSQKIIYGRPYKLVSDLVTKKVIGKALYDKIKDQIAL